MLDLVFDPRAGYYQAPPHFKANNGLFLVDDLGRQIVTPRQLMNRWIVPMERRHDYLMLRNGGKFRIPFDMLLVFSTNLQPADSPTMPSCAASATRSSSARSARRLPPHHARGLREQRRRLTTTDASSCWSRDHHVRDERPLLACYPRDLMQPGRRLRRLSRAAGRALRPSMLDWAWHNYFASHGAAASGTAAT